MNDTIGRGGVVFSRILQAHAKVAILTELFITAVSDFGVKISVRYIPVLVVSKLFLNWNQCNDARNEIGNGHLEDAK